MRIDVVQFSGREAVHHIIATNKRQPVLLPGCTWFAYEYIFYTIYPLGIFSFSIPHLLLCIALTSPRYSSPSHLDLRPVLVTQMITGRMISPREEDIHHMEEGPRCN